MAAAFSTALVSAVVAFTFLWAACGLLGFVATADAAVSEFERTDRDFQGKPFRTRGRIDDNCINNDARCRTAADNDAQESTAQSKAIRELAGIRNETLSGRPVDPHDQKVHWEVGPRSGVWRADIVVDDSPNPHVAQAQPPPGLFEVKAWSGPHTRRLVDDQLTGYEQAAELEGVELRRSGELVGWIQVYEGKDGKRHCVWGERNPLGGDLLRGGRRALQDPERGSPGQFALR